MLRKKSIFCRLLRIFNIYKFPLILTIICKYYHIKYLTIRPRRFIVNHLDFIILKSLGKGL